MTKEILIKDLSELDPVPTSHNAGLKQILLANAETATNITQIAKSRLAAGEVATSHAHQDMEECFFFLSGFGSMVIDGNTFDIKKNRFFRIPYGHSHEITALSDLSFITIGIAIP